MLRWGADKVVPQMEQVADHLSDCQELGVRCYEPHPALNVAIAFCVRCYEPHQKKKHDRMDACDKKKCCGGVGWLQGLSKIRSMLGWICMVFRKYGVVDKCDVLES